MRFNRKQWIVTAVILGGIAGGGVAAYRMGFGANRPTEAADAATERRVASEVPSARAASGKRPAKGAKVARRFADPRTSLSDADRKLYDAVQEALDADDFERTRAAALKAYQSENPDVRQQAVEALGWFGEKSLVDLVTMMADSSEEVASAAANAWEVGLSDVADASLKFAIAQTALGAIGNPDTLTLVGAQFAASAMELIDGASDEKTAERRRVEAVQALVDLMGASATSKRAEVSRELYEEITGHRWVSIDEAERYLRDPENYEPPEAAED